MSKRKRLADLMKEEVGHDTAAVAQGEAGKDLQASAVTNLQTSELTDSRHNRVPGSASGRPPGGATHDDGPARGQPATQPAAVSTGTAAADQSATPKYQRLTRKETRLRDDQLEALSGIARRLNKQRAGRGERITENTLIRVAVDLLVTMKDDLHGVDEDALGEALSRHLSLVTARFISKRVGNSL